jgi:DNA uptake protein ComE-like DNA-binding protein
MNSCTEDELVTKLQVPYYLAQRIIKYRDLLGGYVSYDQLADVYGFNNYELDTSRIIINFDHDLVKKINLNESEFKEIISHPYIDKYTTQAILEYRKFMKSIKTIDELVENNVIAGEKMERIQPYLEVK